MSNWWNQPENLPHWVTIEALSERTSIGAAGMLIDRLEAQRSIVPAEAIQLLMDAYTVSNAERMRAIAEQLELKLYITKTQLKSG